MIPGKPYDPGTRTSRRPTPEKFVHLRKWIAPVLRNIQITSIEEIWNVNEQLEQTANLFISNIISRVIAQIVGKYADGFVTIEGTEDGALHVYIKDVDGAASIIASLAAGTESIGKVQVEGPGQTMLKAAIDDSDGGNALAITAVAAKKHHITMIVLTVDGATNIAFLTAATPLSGPMDFGGSGEPKGMVSNFGNFPLVCATNEAFNITSSAAVQVSGYVVYYDE